jgi:hypothetical protein
MPAEDIQMSAVILEIVRFARGTTTFVSILMLFAYSEGLVG